MLSLNNNKLGNEGAVQIGDALRVNTGLLTLSLNHCAITEPGAKAILQSIKESNFTLANISMDGDSPSHIPFFIIKELQVSMSKVSREKRKEDFHKARPLSGSSTDRRKTVTPRKVTSASRTSSATVPKVTTSTSKTPKSLPPPTKVPVRSKSAKPEVPVKKVVAPPSNTKK
jgi:hypothetical protein